jgi:ADP-ribose pyrophosphatase YjhB (NUDIX family)
MSGHHNPIPIVDFILQRGRFTGKRRNDPFKGYLSLSCGFKYQKENVENAAKREAKEELSLEVKPIEI